MKDLKVSSRPDGGHNDGDQNDSGGTWKNIQKYRIRLRYLHSSPKMPEETLAPDLFLTSAQRKEMERFRKHDKEMGVQMDVGSGTFNGGSVGLGEELSTTGDVCRCVLGLQSHSILPETSLGGVKSHLHHHRHQ